MEMSSFDWNPQFNPDSFKLVIPDGFGFDLFAERFVLEKRTAVFGPRRRGEAKPVRVIEAWGELRFRIANCRAFGPMESIFNQTPGRWPRLSKLMALWAEEA
jgi:hypothetical protein